MHLIPTLKRQWQADVCDFRTSLVYRAISVVAKEATQRIPVLARGWGETGDGLKLVYDSAFLFCN